MAINKEALDALSQKLEAAGVDYTKAQTGGSYTPPPEGRANLRLVGYIETGKHESTFEGQAKTRDISEFIFELSGKNGYDPEDGRQPYLITVRVTRSLNKKGGLFRLFRVLNYDGKAKNPAQLVGNAYRGKVVHRKYKDAQGNERVSAQLQEDGAFTITPPQVESVNEESGEVTLRTIKVAEPRTPLRVFLWDFPDKEQWDSLFIDGQYDAVTDDTGKEIRPARSKNVYQEQIRAAVNFRGSPIDLLLQGGGEEPDLGEDEAPARLPAAQRNAEDDDAAEDDPLADLD